MDIEDIIQLILCTNENIIKYDYCNIERLKIVTSNFLESLKQLERCLDRNEKHNQDLFEASMTPESDLDFFQHEFKDSLEVFFMRLYSTISNFINYFKATTPKSIYSQFSDKKVTKFIQKAVSLVNSSGIIIDNKIKSDLDDFRVYRTMIDHPQNHKALHWMTISDSIYTRIIYIKLEEFTEAEFKQNKEECFDFFKLHFPWIENVPFVGSDIFISPYPKDAYTALMIFINEVSNNIINKDTV